MRIGLVLLGLIGLQVGTWATLAPESFYDDFPGGGRSWVAADGPYNEHLIRDLGALNLALVAVVAVALVTWAPAAIRAAGFAWLVYGLPHLVYHAGHLHLLAESSDKTLNVIALSLTVACALVVLVLSFRPLRAGAPAPGPEGTAGTPADRAGVR